MDNPETPENAELEPEHLNSLIGSAEYNHKRPISYIVRRVLWSLFQLPFWWIAPRQLSGLRVFILRLFGAKIGPKVYITRGVRIWEPWNLTLGDYAIIGDGVEIYNLSPVTVGEHTTISQYSYICTATHDYTDPRFTLTHQPIIFGKSVWIASGCFIGPGVTIGDGAVIGVRSLVLKSMPAWTVSAGHPCKPIKRRVVQTEA